MHSFNTVRRLGCPFSLLLFDTEESKIKKYKKNKSKGKKIAILQRNLQTLFGDGDNNSNIQKKIEGNLKF